MKILVVGAGEVGYNLAKRLVAIGNNVTLLEANSRRFKAIDGSLNAKIIQGSGSDPRLMKESNLRPGDIVLAVTDSDEINTVTCLFASVYCPEVVKIARIKSHDFTAYPEVYGPAGLGISLCVNPDYFSAQAIARILATPGTSEVVDLADGRIKLLGMRIDKKSAIIGKKLMEFRAEQQHTPFVVAAIQRKQQVFVPNGLEVLESGDFVFVVTATKDAPTVVRIFGKATQPPKDLVVVGASYVAVYLGKLLAGSGIRMRIIEKDQRKVDRLKEILPHVDLIPADGTDLSVLESLNLAKADVFAALTSEEEVNVLASLQAKQFGVRQVITLIDKTNYIPLVSTFGTDIVISPRLMAVDCILQFLRRGIVITGATLRDDTAETLSVPILEGSPFAGQRLNQITLPPGSIVAAIERGDSIKIPSGDSTIIAGDRLAVFALKSAIPHIEARLH